MRTGDWRHTRKQDVSERFGGLSVREIMLSALDIEPSFVAAARAIDIAPNTMRRWLMGEGLRIERRQQTAVVDAQTNLKQQPAAAAVLTVANVLENAVSEEEGD